MEDKSHNIQKMSRQKSDPLNHYFRDIKKKPLLSAKQEIELAKEIENNHRELTYILCRYGEKNSETSGLALLEKRLREVLGEENVNYQRFLKLKDNISNRRRKKPTELYEQVFDLLYYSNDERGISGRFICDVARESTANMTKYYQGKTTRCLSSIEQDKKRFVESNLRLVAKIAQKYAWATKLSLLDLVQEGNIGLMKAIDGYDYRKGHKLSTYATWWIRQKITRAVQDTGRTIRRPVYTYEFLHRCKKTAEKLSQQLGREPSNGEIAEDIGVPTERVNNIFNTGITISLDNPRGDGNVTLIDLVKSETIDFSKELMLKDYCVKVLASLKPREADILMQRFGLDGEGRKTLEEVGEQYGVTRERIRQIEAMALRKIRKKAKEKQRLEENVVSPEKELIEHPSDKKTSVDKQSVPLIYPEEKAFVEVDSKRSDEEKDWRQVKQYEGPYLSLDELVHDGKTTIANVVEKIGFSRYSRIGCWEEILDTLEPRETDVIIQWFDLDSEGERSLEMMSNHYGLPEKKVRLIQRRALEKLGKMARVKMRSGKQ